MERDKIDIILDLTEYPERYSEDEIRRILSDPEMHELYQAIAMTRGAEIKKKVLSEKEIEAQWEKFQKKHSNRIFRRVRLSSKVAVCIAILSVSLLAVAIGNSLSNIEEDKADATVSIANNYLPGESDDGGKIYIESSKDSINTPENREIIFENTPLEQLLNSIAGEKGYEVRFLSDTPRTLRLYYIWDQSLPMEEIAEQLNHFEKIDIELKDSIITIK